MSSSWGKDEHGPGGDPSWLGGGDRRGRDAPEASRAPEPERRVSADFAGADTPTDPGPPAASGAPPSEPGLRGAEQTRWSPSFGEHGEGRSSVPPQRRGGIEGFVSRIDGPRLIRALGSFAVAVVFLLIFTQGFGGAGGVGSSFGAFPWMFLLIAGIPVVKALFGRGRD